MKKRSFASVAAVMTAAAIGVTACGGGASQPTTAAPTAAEAKEPAEGNKEEAEASGGSWQVGNIEEVSYKVSTSAKSSTLDIPGYGAGIKYFCEEVEKRSGGKVKMQLFLDAQLGGSADEMIGGCTTGAFEFITLNQGSWGDYTDGFMPFNIPFLFDSKEIAYEFMDGEQGRIIRDKIIEDTGVRVLCFYDMGYRHLTNDKRTVKTADDIKGLKVRTQADPYQMAPFEAMGASVTTTAYSELFSALQQGLVDAQENPLSNIVINKYYEVQDYMTLTGHTYSLTTMAVSEDVWQSMSPDLQALMEEVARDSVALCREGLATSEAEDLETLKGVMEVYEPTEEEKATFKEACQPCWEEIKASIGEGRFSGIINEIERIKASIK